MTHRERERESGVSGVRAALHQEAGAPCAPGAQWARFFFPTRPARTDSPCGGVGEGSFQRNSRLKASEAKPSRSARPRQAEPAEGDGGLQGRHRAREREIEIP